MMRRNRRIHDLQAIEEDASATGLTERFQADDCQVDALALSPITEYGERHPRTTMSPRGQTAPARLG